MLEFSSAVILFSSSPLLSGKKGEKKLNLFGPVLPCRVNVDIGFVCLGNLMKSDEKYYCTWIITSDKLLLYCTE